MYGIELRHIFRCLHHKKHDPTCVFVLLVSRFVPIHRQPVTARDADGTAGALTRAATNAAVGWAGLLRI